VLEGFLSEQTWKGKRQARARREKKTEHCSKLLQLQRLFEKRPPGNAVRRDSYHVHHGRNKVRAVRRPSDSETEQTNPLVTSNFRPLHLVVRSLEQVIGLTDHQKKGITVFTRKTRVRDG
jgi:hypothetical protein